jgi:hypothetical protein
MSEDGDLFCDEEFGEGRCSNRTHEFSFEQGGESGRTGCILELAEEEEVVSPVFKAI